MEIELRKINDVLIALYELRDYYNESYENSNEAEVKLYSVIKMNKINKVIKSLQAQKKLIENI